MRIYYAARIVFQSLLGIVRPARQAVLASFSKSQEDLVGLIDTQAGVIIIAYRDTIKQDPDFSVARRVNIDASVLQRSADDVMTAAADDDSTVIEIGTAA